MFTPTGVSFTKKLRCWFYIWGGIEQITFRLTYSILHLSLKSLLFIVFLLCSKNLCITILLADDIFQQCFIACFLEETFSANFNFHSIPCICVCCQYAGAILSLSVVHKCYLLQQYLLACTSCREKQNKKVCWTSTLQLISWWLTGSLPPHNNN